MFVCVVCTDMNYLSGTMCFFPSFYLRQSSSTRFIFICDYLRVIVTNKNRVCVYRKTANYLTHSTLDFIYTWPKWNVSSCVSSKWECTTAPVASSMPSGRTFCFSFLFLLYFCINIHKEIIYFEPKQHPSIWTYRKHQNCIIRNE